MFVLNLERWLHAGLVGGFKAFFILSFLFVFGEIKVVVIMVIYGQ